LLNAPCEFCEPGGQRGYRLRYRCDIRRRSHYECSVVVASPCSIAMPLGMFLRTCDHVFSNSAIARRCCQCQCTGKQAVANAKNAHIVQGRIFNSIVRVVAVVLWCRTPWLRPRFAQSLRRSWLRSGSCNSPPRPGWSAPGSRMRIPGGNRPIVMLEGDSLERHPLQSGATSTCVLCGTITYPSAGSRRCLPDTLASTVSSSGRGTIVPAG